MSSARRSCPASLSSRRYVLTQLQMSMCLDPLDDGFDGRRILAKRFVDRTGLGIFTRVGKQADEWAKQPQRKPPRCVFGLEQRRDRATVEVDIQPRGGF